jgi:hypothetical protein
MFLLCNRWHFCFSRPATGNGICQYDEVNELALAFHSLGRDEIHARSHIGSFRQMLWEYRYRHPNNTATANKTVVNKHYGRLMYLRRKARADEIIAEFNRHMPTFDQVKEYCGERKWPDARTLMPIIKHELGCGGRSPARRFVATREIEPLEELKFTYGDATSNQLFSE